MRCLPRSTGTLGLASRLPRPRGWPRCPRLRPAPARRAGPAGPCRASSPGAIIMRTPRRRSTSSRPDTRGITARSRSRTGSGRRCCGRSTAQHYRRRGGPGRRSGGGADLPGRAATPAAGRSTSRTTGCTTPTTTSAGRPTASQALTGSRPGQHQLRFEFEPTGKPDSAQGKSAPGLAQLYVDGQLIASREFPVTTPIAFNPGGLTCGATLDPRSSRTTRSGRPSRSPAPCTPSPSTCPATSSPTPTPTARCGWPWPAVAAAPRERPKRYCDELTPNVHPQEKEETSRP